MLGGEVTVGWQAGRARLPVLLQTQGPSCRAGGSVGACSLLVFTLCPRALPPPTVPIGEFDCAVHLCHLRTGRCPTAVGSGLGSAIAVTSRPGGSIRAHPWYRLLPPRSAFRGLLDGVLGSQVGCCGRERWCLTWVGMAGGVSRCVWSWGQQV